MSNCDYKKFKLLFFIWDKGNVDKCCIIYIIELGFFLFSCMKNLILAVFMRTIANNIRENTIYTYLGIGVKSN